MPPKEKAKELFDKYVKIIYAITGGIGGKTSILAKQCALLAVDEIINENEENEVSQEIAYTIATFLTNEQYWHKVKEEINKL
jgi:hypothetical protein